MSNETIIIESIVRTEVSVETFLEKHIADARTFKDDKDRSLDLYRWNVPANGALVRVAHIDLTLAEWEELDGVMYKDSYKLIDFAKANKSRIKGK